MRLTRRGIAVAAGATLGIVLAGLFGARSLNAVVAPALVALAAGAVQVYRAGEPEVERTALTPGFPGDERTVQLRVTTDGPTRLVETTDSGLRPGRIVREVAGDAVVDYELELVSRGLHRVGPVETTVTDALGLVAADYRFSTHEEVLVYPQVLPVTDPGAFAGLVDAVGTPDRQTFDRVREYQSGDALRDVSWKASAKQPAPEDLVVVEFAATDEGTVTVAAEGTVTVAAEGTDDVDAVATAAASVSAFLLDADLDVGVVVPDGRLDAGAGERHREAILGLLGRTGGGRLGGSDVDDADVQVRERSDDTVVVDVRGREVRFDDVVDDRTFDGDGDAPTTVPSGADATDDRTGSDSDRGSITA